MNLKQIYNNQRFKTNIVSLFINPFYFIRLRLYHTIKELAQEFSGRTLDFGCGSKPYRSLFKVNEYIGLDFQGEGHDHKNEEIDFFYDGKTIPFENNSFDHVISSEVFEHIFNLDEIFSELKRVLKPGGTMLFSIPFSWYEHEEPRDFARYTSFGISHILNKHGFQIISQRKTGHFAEALWQLWIAYIYHIFESKNKFLNVFFTFIFISPFNILGTLILWMFPKNNRYYHNQVLFVIKGDDLGNK